MININLLPWREKERKKNQLLFYSGITLSIVIALLVILSIHFHYTKLVNRQVERNKILQNEITVATQASNKLLKYKKMKRLITYQIQMLQKLQYDRFQAVTLFNKVTHIIPKGIYLSTMERKKQVVILGGQANSNILISQLIKQIDKQKRLTHPILSEVTTRDNKGLQITRFELKFRLLSPYTDLKPVKQTGKKS